jgi:hypothetical protein
MPGMRHAACHDALCKADADGGAGLARSGLKDCDKSRCRGMEGEWEGEALMMSMTQPGGVYTRTRILHANTRGVGCAGPECQMAHARVYKSLYNLLGVYGMVWCQVCNI